MTYNCVETMCRSHFILCDLDKNIEIYLFWENNEKYLKNILLSIVGVFLSNILDIQIFCDMLD